MGIFINSSTTRNALEIIYTRETPKTAAPHTPIQKYKNHQHSRESLNYEHPYRLHRPTTPETRLKRPHQIRLQRPTTPGVCKNNLVDLHTLFSNSTTLLSKFFIQFTHIPITLSYFTIHIATSFPSVTNTFFKLSGTSCAIKPISS